MPQIQKLEKWLEEFVANCKEYYKAATYHKNGKEQSSANLVVIFGYQAQNGLFPFEMIAEANKMIIYRYHANGFWSRKHYSETEFKYFINEGIDDSSIKEISKAIKKEVDAGLYGVNFCRYPTLEKLTDKEILELSSIKGLIVEI